MDATSHPEASESSQRRERAAIAAQACQTCRTRKSKCDEVRPKCGLCRRLDVDCEYREPLPTKKDKTMLQILESLARLENKFDNLAIRGATTVDGSEMPTPAIFSPERESPSVAGAAKPLPTKQDAKDDAKEAGKPDQDGSSSAASQAGDEHLTVSHKIVLWPSIYVHLINSNIVAASDLQFVLQEGTSWFIRREMQKYPEPLPFTPREPSFPMSQTPSGAGEAYNVYFINLSVREIQELTDAYFNTFNILHPLLNRDTFMNDTVARLLREGHADGDPGSVLALTVFALGKVAIQGVFDRPVSVVNHQPSGIRGGTAQQPPGLSLFNEARRRLGFIMTMTSLENVQIMLLQATYYGSTARHLEFWRSTVSASMACQVLIRCQQIDWVSPYGDLVKRAYWTCVLSEDLYHLDLDLPQTGIHKLEDEVPLPYFYSDPDKAPGSGASKGKSPAAEERSYYQYHFLAMIALRRLISRTHRVIHECERAVTNSEPLYHSSGKGSQADIPPAERSADTPSGYGGPPVMVIKEMARQLDSWRALLPRPLQWNDSDRFDFPAVDPLAQRPNEPLFSMDQGPVPIGHRYNLDVVSAQLRTRFYYARFMIFRPFVYRALHFPEIMEVEDYRCCALAIKSACLWPLAMAPPKNKKRLVPHLFAWTQNFIGILLILRMCSVNDCLRKVVDESGVVGREEIERTSALLMNWIEDVKQIDGIAEWSWQILEPLYGAGTSRSTPE